MLLLSALSLEAASDWSGGAVDSVLLLPGGANGQMPNLDLPAAMLKLAAWLGVDAHTLSSSHSHSHGDKPQGRSSVSAVLDAACSSVDAAHAAISRVAGCGAARFLHGQPLRSALSGLLVSLAAQLGGKPGGVHGVMREVQVDAVTVRVRGGPGGRATHLHVDGASRRGGSSHMPLRYSVTRMGR